MNKAFLFDFDGVIVNSENIWKREEEGIFSQLYGYEIYQKLGPTTGISYELTHQKAQQLGTTVTLQKVDQEFQERAPQVYKNAQLTPDLQELKDELLSRNFHLGIVSASPKDWIKIVLKRLRWNVSEFKIVLSLHEEPTIAHKPSPEGYIHAIKELGASPETTLILEDTNAGIESAKASGATVIGFKENLVPGYQQTGADFYAEDIEDVIKIVRNAF